LGCDKAIKVSKKIHVRGMMGVHGCTRSFFVLEFNLKKKQKLVIIVLELQLCDWG
jgi:hypothetical protein